MKAHLRSVRIAPKKANLVAKMVRGKPVPLALSSLERTNKKAARLLEELIRSAAANAKQNDNQNPDDLVIKTLTVNKSVTYHRGIPMARGRMRRIRKFLSHISVTLGYPENQEKKEEGKKKEEKDVSDKSKEVSKKATTKKAASKKSATKKAASSSQKKKTPVKSAKKTTKSKTSAGSSKKKTTKKTTDSSKSSSASNSSK